MKYLQLIVLVFTLGLFSCKPQSKEIRNISVIELKNKIATDKNIQLLDVRTPQEWNEGIIEGALKVDVTSNNFETKADNVLDKKKEVYVYCRSGGRSVRASEILLKKGYKPVNILGGYKDWESKIK